MKTSGLSLALFSMALLTACTPGEDDVYTLYRNGAQIADAETRKPGILAEMKTLRIHVATFDGQEGKQYNRENCEIAQKLFQTQNGVTSQYWCEIGRFKK